MKRFLIAAWMSMVMVAGVLGLPNAIGHHGGDNQTWGSVFISMKDKWLPLTHYIRTYVPKALIALALVWLAAHFDIIPTP